MLSLQKKNLFAYLLLALALVSLIFAIVCFTTDTSYASGSYETSQKYGGDAYTGIQNAAAQTANNVYYMNKNLTLLIGCVATTGGLFFLLAALTFALMGVKKLGLFEEKEAPQAEEIPEVQAEPVAEEAPAPEETPAPEAAE